MTDPSTTWSPTTIYLEDSADDPVELDVARSTWATRLDVTGAYRDDVHRLEASLLMREDGFGAIYPARVNTVIGESESAKSWVALVACAEQLALGHSVAFLDFEDDKDGVGIRLKDMGVPEDAARDRFYYLNPTGSPDLSAFVAEFGEDFSLVVIDAMTTGLGEAGLDPNRDVEVVRWIDAFARPMSRRGPAVLVVDHVGKDSTRGARGSAAKREAVTGTQLLAIKRALVAPGKRGVTSLMVGKDRAGSVRSVSHNGTHFADIVIDGELRPGDDGPKLRSTIVSPIPDSETAALTRVTRALARLAPTEASPVTTKQVQQATARTTADGEAAPDYLSVRRVQEGLATLHINGGVGRRDSGRTALWWVT